MNKKLIDNCLECAFFVQYEEWKEGQGYCHFNPESLYINRGNIHWCGRGEVKKVESKKKKK